MVFLLFRWTIWIGLDAVDCLPWPDRRLDGGGDLAHTYATAQTSSSWHDPSGLGRLWLVQLRLVFMGVPLPHNTSHSFWIGVKMEDAIAKAFLASNGLHDGHPRGGLRLSLLKRFGR
jgi:hypothetical protein